MNILVAGMSQSGSTLLFNIIRNCYIQNGHKVNSILSTNGTTKSGYINIMKCHGYEFILHHISNLIITPIRDLRDCVASTKQRNPTFKNGNVIEIGRNNLRWYNDWKKHSNYEFKYEDYKNNPMKILREVSKVLKLELDDEALKIVHAEVESLPTNKNLPEIQDGSEALNPLWCDTLLSKHHITNGGKIGGYDRLTENEIKQLESIFNSWLKEHNYL